MESNHLPDSRDKKGHLNPLEIIESHLSQLPAAADNERLAQLGHAQELDRQFSLWTLTSLCLCLMATWEALSSVIAAALVSGGAPCLFYNYLLSFICSVCITLSLGEIASMYPTAGGQYHWVAALSPSSSKSSAAWMTGWISIGGQIVFTASAAFAAGLMFLALISLNHETYVPQRWQGMLFYWAILLYAGALNIWGSKMLPHTNAAAGVLHIAGFVAIVVVLGVKAPKNTSSFVFKEFANSSGWENDGVSWLVGLLSAVYPFLGYDAACHLAEEMPNASRNVPIAMVGSVVVNGILGLVYCILLLFSVTSLDSILSTPTGFPTIQIFLDATNSTAGATVMTVIMPLIATAATVAGVASTSRTLWAFARDKATPFDGYLSHVNPSLKIPVRAVVVVVVLQMILGFLYLGNTTAFNAILSMAIIGLYLSYALPILYMLIVGRKNLKSEEYGPRRLGNWIGPILNIVSIIWMIVVIVFSTFPSMRPVSPQNMNYSVVVISSWTLFGVLYYFWFGRAKFEVPTQKMNVVDGIRVA